MFDPFACLCGVKKAVVETAEKNLGVIVEKSNLYNSIGVYSFMFLQSFRKFGIIDPLLIPL
jgi:hypothetical protein